MSIQENANYWPDDDGRRLRLVQAELRTITGTPIEGEDDRLRRMALWRELDVLIRHRDGWRR
jgi:hypothetical protein